MTHAQHFQVVWLDPDVHFLNSNWVNDTSARLDEVNVVQPFAFAYELRAGDDSEKLDANEVTWSFLLFSCSSGRLTTILYYLQGSGIRKYGDWTRTNVLWGSVRCTPA